MLLVGLFAVLQWAEFTQKVPLTRSHHFAVTFYAWTKNYNLSSVSFIFNFLMNALHIFKYASQP